MTYCDEGIETALLDGAVWAMRRDLPVGTLYRSHHNDIDRCASEPMRGTGPTFPVIVVRWPDGSTPNPPLRLVPAIPGEKFQ